MRVPAAEGQARTDCGTGEPAAKRRLLGLVCRLRHPRTTVRWRLTLLYGGMFLVCGAALLALTYGLVASQVSAPSRVGVNFPVGSPPRVSAPQLTVSKRTTKRLPPVRPCYAPRASNQCLLFTDPSADFLRLVITQQRTDDLQGLVIWSAIALGVMAVVSGLLGWVVAGRVLRPLRTITATAQQISEADLHRRLDLPGPRDEVRTLADTVDALLARLEAAFDAQRLFVANASHELRTPLAMMRTTLDVALTTPDGVAPQVKALDADLREDLDHADRLLEGFLVLARAQYGELGRRSSVALDEIVGSALARRASQIAAKHLDVRTSLSAIRVAGSETLLARMIENVIENAVRHTEAHGLVEVRLGLDGDHAQLVVETDGPLLDERHVAELARPFKRLGQDRTYSQNGHGLGLSIVRAVAAAHGGELALKPRARGGLRAQVTLPGASAAQPRRVGP